MKIEETMEKYLGEATTHQGILNQAIKSERKVNTESEKLINNIYKMLKKNNGNAEEWDFCINELNNVIRSMEGAVNWIHEAIKN